ncbi:hypothetical protein IAD21_05386 [Abditibacteriota bacterium]|nr:hypothetical protein IAD21_05386 [Abditibacteriota bacterium]
MPNKQYHVSLSATEREELEQVARSTRRAAREKTRARVLLLCDTNRSLEDGGPLTDATIAHRLHSTLVTVAQVRRRACERGAVAAVTHKEQAKRKARKLDGAGEAALVALTCSTPPQGQSQWTLKLLRQRLIVLEVVEQIGVETIRTTLKKTNLSRG